MRLLAFIAVSAAASSAGVTGPVSAVSAGGSGVQAAACALREQVGRAMTPGQTPDTTAPQMPLGDEPATLSIVPDQPNYVRLELSAPGTLVVFSSEVDVLMHLQEGVEPLPADEPAPVEGCPDQIPERHDIVVDAAGTYHLRVAWAGFRTLWVYADLLPPA
jgi:hypothetical protein